MSAASRAAPAVAAVHRGAARPMAVPLAPAPWRIWCFAALGAVVIHGCAALAVGHLKPDTAAAESGAPAIEVGLDLLAPRHDDSELPAGPDSEASAASAAVAEHKTAVEETELPKAVAAETGDPDRVVAADATRKNSEDDTRTASVETPPSNPSIAAPAAAAMPSPEAAAPALRSVAPAPGNGESLRRVRTTWQKELAAHLDRYKRYPDNRTGRSAEIVISFVLDRTGRVMSASVATSSGDGAFDDAALAMIRRADPVPPPPPAVADETLSFNMPVIFHKNAKQK